MNAIQFDPKNKSAEITYNQLILTDTLADHNGELPKNCPIEGGELIERISNSIIRHTGMQPVAKPIVIREQYCSTSRQAARSGRDLELKDYQIQRFVTVLEIPQPAFAGTPNEMNPGIAITYANTQAAKGIQIAYGENVQVCENLTAFGKFRFSTYGGSKVSFDEGMQLMNHWLQNFGQVHQAHLDVIGELMNIEMERQRMHKLIGSLFERAVRYNSGEYSLNAPLNQTQISAMVQQGLNSLQAKDTFSAWEFLNWGTDILKPHNSDMVSLIETNTKFNDFILEEFGVSFQGVESFE